MARKLRELLGKVFEKVDGKPVALPSHVKKPTEADRLKEIMGRLIREVGDGNRRETLEESLDFELGEDDGDEMFARFGVSQSEMRYMKEENLLTEAEEAARIRHQRHRDADFYRRFKNGKENERRRGGSERDGSGERSDGAGDAAQKRDSSDREGGKQSGGERGV